MILNYNSLNSGRDTWFKKGDLDGMGAPPSKAKRWFLSMLLLFCMLCAGFSVNAQIGVTVTGGASTTPNLSATYPNFTAAVAALNGVTAMSGPVTFTLAAGTSETAPVKGFNISTATAGLLSAVNTLTIVKAAGAATVINAGVGTSAGPTASSDGMLYLSGSDYVTIDGLTFTDGNSTNATVAMEFGIAFFKRAAGDGCNNNTVQNCIFNMQRINNTAGAGPMLDGAYGIEVLNSTAIAAVTSLTPTNGGTLATNGTNSNNAFYSNTINGGNGGIGLGGYAATAGVGPTPTATTFLGDLNNIVGASTLGNSILNFGGGAVTNAAAGIRAVNQWSVKINYNIVDNNNGSGVNHATTLRGIYAQSGTSAAASISNNTVTVRSGATTSALNAIDNGIGSTALSTNTIDINSNIIRFSYTTATSGVFIAINNSASAGTVNINSNNIQQLSSTNYPTTGTVTVIVGGSPGGPLNVTNNTISNFVLTGASGTLRVITASTPTGLYTITGNTIDGLSYTTAASTGSITGIYNLASATLQNINNNIIRNFSTPTTGTLNGIQNNTVAGTFQCRNNQIYNFSTTAGGAGGFTANGILWSNANVDISGNLVYAINSSGTTGGTGGTINGISHSGAATVTGNAIYNLSSNSTNAVINGLVVAASGTNTVSNNLIGDLRAPFSTGNVAISGILVSSGTTNNIFHNTVNIASTTSSTTTFGTSAVYFSSTTPVNNVRNNVFVNTSSFGPTGGIAAALRYTVAPTSTNFPAANNNNLYYAGTPGASRLIYTEGSASTATNGQQTIAAYKTYISTTLPVGGRESSSGSENPTWQSTSGSNPITNFLQYSTSISSQIEQGGGTGTGITTDFTGITTRCPNATCPGTVSLPDMGAWELNGVALPACLTPTAQPTSFATANIASTSIDVSFTAATGSPSGYLVVATTGAAPSAPVVGTSYAIGSTALGATTIVVANGSGVSYTASGLASNTAYTFYVYSYNNTSCASGPAYYTTSPLVSSSISTCVLAPVASAATSIAGTSFTANWAASAGATSYLLDVSTSSTFATFLPSYTGVNVGNVTTISVTGLAGLTTYYYRVRANTGSCTTGNSATITTTTIGALPWSEGFTGITVAPTGWTATSWTIGTTTGVTGNPANALYQNFYSSNTSGSFTTPTFANVPSGATFAYQYNLMNWNTTTAVTGTWGTVQYQISVNGGAFANLGAAVTAVTGTGYVAQSIDLSPYVGSTIQIKMNVTWTAGDYNLSFDNFSILSPCVTPGSPTALVQGATGPGSIAESFTPNATAPDGYMVVRYPTTSVVTPPTNGTTTYATGQALGLGTISNVVSGASSSFTISGLSPSTTYDVYVYPYTINNCIGGPVFGSALSATQSTAGCPAIPTTVTVGATGNYTSLSALALILNGCPISNPVLVELQSNYSPAGETLPIVFNNNTGSSATNTVTIRPAAGAGPFAISGSSTSALLDLNGARYFTFDGRAGGVGASALSITNNGNGAALRLFNDAQNNTIQSVALKSSNIAATNGVVRITSAAGATLANGNNNNTITGCTIDGSGVSPNGVYCSGSTAPADNKSNVISNNSIFNFYSDVAATPNYGILFAGNNGVSASSAWTVSGNSFYQTASRAFATNAGIICSIGGGFTPAGALNITGNFIGGTAANAGGTAQTLSGAAAYTFTPINILLGGADASTISGNTIANFNVTTASTSTTNALITASTTLAGNTVSIANNTLGSASTAGSISFNAGGSAVLSAISAGSYYSAQLATSFSITGNTIAGIALTATTNANSFRGINIGTAVTATAASVITGNTIGSSAAPISNASVGTSTGILNANAIGSSIRNNTVSYLTESNTGSSVQLVGISTTAGSNVIGSVGGNGNTISNFTSAAANTGTTSSASVIGISQTSSTAGQSVASNRVSLLANTGTAAATVNGIYFSGPTTGTNEVNNNLVHTLSSNTAASAVNGIQIADSGNATVYNNILRLGLDAAGAAATNDVAFAGINQSSTASNHGIYFNTVYVGGSVTGASNTFAITSAATSGTRAIRNNVITNLRTTASGLAKHYAIKVSGLTDLTVNNNDYWTGSISTLLALNNATDATSLLAWQASTTQDGGSISVDPNFINPTAAAASFDLHITGGVSSALESGGASIPGITTDYDSQVRPGPAGSVNGGALSADMGADEFDGIPGFTCASLTGLTAVTTNAIVCNSTAVLSVAGSVNGTGITYQWQVASTQTGTYATIGGATFSTYTVPTTAVSDLWYQCVVTCANGPVSAIAAAVNVKVSACNYAVTRNTAVPYNSIITTGSTFTSLSSADDGFTNFVPLTGTTFKYRGQAVTQFYATSNGTMSFSSTQNNHTGYGNLTTSTAGKDLMLAPYWTDFVIKANTTTNLNASMRYKVNGTLGSGSADIIIEWAEMEGFSFTNPNMNFQVVLHESNNSIEYNYGSMLKFDGATNSTGTFATVCAIGLNGNTPATADLGQRLILQNANSTNFGTTSVTNLLQTPACNSQLVFTPAVAYSGGAAPATVPANNELAGAFPLTVNGAPCTSNCGISYYSLGATASAGTTVCSATTPGNADDDVWFTFTPSTTTANHKIVVTPSFGYDAVVQLIDLFDNSVVQCVNAAGVALTETISSVTLNQAHTYALRIYDAGTGAFGGGEFSVCVSEIIAPPVNDDPAGAIALTVGSSCTPTNSLLPSTLAATATAGVTACNATTPGTPDDDVWYSFTTSSTAGLTYSMTATGVSAYNAVLQLFSGTPAALTSVSCANTNNNGVAETITSSTLTASTTYYLRVYHAGTGAANGNFSICVSVPAPVCVTAPTAPANASAICVSATATTLSWAAVTNATKYDVYLDNATGTTLVSADQTALTYVTPSPLAAGTYTWSVVPKNDFGSATACTNFTFTVSDLPTTATNGSAASICSGGNVVLSGNAPTSGTGSWSVFSGPSTAAAQFANVADPATTFTPTASGTYVVRWSITACSVSTADATITVNGTPTALTVTATGGGCENEVLTLTATGGDIPTSPVTLGTQSTTEFGGGVYRYGFGTGDFRHQLLYTKAELNAAGITGPSTLTGIAFTVTSVGSGSADNYAISLANTPATVLSTTFETTSLTPVYNAATYTAVSGVNTHTFSTPFSWDGTSNVLVNICYTVASTGGSSTLAATTPAALSNSNLLGSAGACTATTATSTFANRPLATFAYLGNAPVNWTTSPAATLYTAPAANAGTEYVAGSNARVVYARPAAGTTTYNAFAVNGTCQSSASTSFTPNPLPIIAGIANTTICLGTGTTLTVTAEPGTSYTWYKDAVLPGNIVASVPGFPNAYFANPTVTTTYFVKATNNTFGCQSVQSVLVSVNNPVDSTISPLINNVAEGTNTAFTVTPSGTFSGYQWQVLVPASVANPTPVWTDLSGETAATLSLTAVTAAMNTNQYRCVIKGTAPCADVPSPEATLNVSDVGIGTQPLSQNLCFVPSIYPVAFTTVGSSNPPGATFEYQWSVNDGSGFQPITDGLDATIVGLDFSGAASGELHINSGLTLANSGLAFICTVNGFLDSNIVTLTLSQGPTFDSLGTQPVDRTVCSSGTTSATYTVTALNTSAYQWQELVPVSVANPTPVWTNVTNGGIYGGATTATLTVSNAPLTADGNQYKCIITGVTPCGAATAESTPRFLYINNPTVATPPANATVLAGATATFTATTAAAAPTYDWQYSANGTTGWASIAALPAGFTYDTSIAGTLGVTTPTSATAGNYFYRVVVTSGGCTSAPSSAATLTVNNYCTSVPTSNDGSGVTNVDISSGSFTIADVTYADNTATPVDVTQSFNTTVLVSFATGFTYDSNIWIDFNNDGDFVDVGELVKSGTSLSTNPTILDLSFVMPISAPLGQHRMRIGTADSGQLTPTPCYSGSFGVTLDFTVNVLPAPQCTGTPVAGTVTTPNAAGCAGGTFALTLSGYTPQVAGLNFQWYGRALPSGTFAAISGATDVTYSPVVTVASEFYCTVTCANGGSPAQSNTVAISVVNCDYAVTRNTGITYNSIITTGSTYTSLSSADDGYTNFVPLTGTTFKYRGTAVTQFFATSNGTMSFSSTQNTHTSYGDLTTTTAGKDLMLAPFWSDLVVKGNTTTNRDLSMRYKVNGTLGSGTADIIIEWAEMEGFSFTNPNLNFQVVLHESDNSIEYNYGNMLKFDGLANSTGTIATTCAIGLNGNSPSTVSTTQRLILQNANTSNFGTTLVTNVIQTPECNSQLRFVPAAAYSGGSAPAASQANDAATSAAIAATATTLPVNDNPCASQCGTIYSSKNATATTGLTVCSATTAGNADDDVFFKFTSAVGTFNYRIQVQSSFSYDAVVQVLDSSLTPVACSNATGTGLTELISGLALNSNQVYYLRIYDAGTGSGGSGEFAVCVSKVVPPPAFDEPAGALTLNVGTTCSPTNSVIADVLNSTATTGVQTCSAGTPGTPTADVWYKFTTGANVTGLTHTITVTGVSTYNPVLQVFPALPTLTNALTCVNATTNGQAETYSSSTLLANTTYYVRVYNSSGGAANGNFNICVSSTPSCVASPIAPVNASSACISGSGTTLSWAAAANAQSYDVYLDSTGGTSLTPVSSAQTALTYTTPAALAAGTYTWRLVPRNVYGAATACTNFTFTVNPTPSLTGVAQAATVCPSTNATINLSGLIANSTSTVTYTIGAGGPVVVTNVIASGTTASFTVPVVFANNGQVLTITNITRTNVPTNCSFVPTSNNTVTLSVYNTYPFYVDTDGDTYGTGAAILLCSTGATVPPTGYSVNNLDCNDTNGSIWRNGTFYVDADGDGYNNGAPSVIVCYGGTNPVGYTPSNIGTDCLDSNFEVNPNHVEVMANGIDDNCDGAIDEVAPTTALQVSQCGSTLTNLSQAIYASQVIGAQGYRFEVTEVGNPANVRTYDAVANSFNLSNLSGGANYNTTYSIRVAVKTAPGFWRSYSTSCTVTTPAVAATTNVSFPACGITLSNIATTIYCDAVSNATGYRFRVTDGVTTSTFDTTVNRFNLTNVNANFGTTYTVDVQLRFGTTWETTWGSVCSFTTPATPGTSNVIAAQCGVNITNLWATIYATQISVATGYRFEVTKSGGGTVFYDTPNSRFSLRNITVPGFTATNASYSIRVSILYNSIYQPFGSACTITTTGASRVTSTPVDVFEVKAYPNPFAANFKLEINTSSENNVGVKVYDMIGREIEVRESSLSQMTTLEIGDLYPTGVYNIVVTQGDKVKTLRVIKR